ncbi:MAG: hypothetical protein MPK75_00175 [Alphaproteobacteria bacterium]|nr:hypothetical protein [Alphaproteobacteria bacterium]
MDFSRIHGSGDMDLSSMMEVCMRCPATRPYVPDWYMGYQSPQNFEYPEVPV